MSQKRCKIGPLSQWSRKSHTRFRLVPKSSTFDDLEWPWTAKTDSVAEKMRLLEPAAQIWMKIDPYYQRQMCRPMTLVSGNIRFKWHWGLSTTAIFGDLCGYRLRLWKLENVRDTASNIIRRHATPSRPVTDCKMNDLEWWDVGMNIYCLSNALHSSIGQNIQEAQLRQRKSVSCACLPIGWLTDRAKHRTTQNRRGCTISDIQTLWFKKC